MEEKQRPRVGVGVMILKDGKVLLGKRKGDGVGAGHFAWPGGHLEYMESFEDCAMREVMEETGMQIENIRFCRLVNFKEYAPKHYVDIGFIADWKSGEPRVMEPDKTDEWKWYPMDSIPEPLFAAEPYYFKTMKTGQVFFDN